MEIITAISEMFGSYGFPAIICIYMIHHQAKTYDTLLKQQKESIDKSNQLITDNTIAINNLTSLITHFIDRGDSHNG